LIRRIVLPQALQASATTDPVTAFLSLLAKHWDNTLNRDAWSRQVSFLLSGVMLFASFNSALQTFLLLARAFPSLAASATAFRDASLALLISQVVATYVISSALLLRSNLPENVGSVISEALKAPLEPKKVDAWFELWFLGAAGLTVLGIWIGRKLGEEDDEMERGGKRS
jgi:hypothetical protein